MYAGERLVASDGYEVALFPMTYLKVTQGEHSGSQLAMDFAHRGSGHTPYYAPCTCICLYVGYSTNPSGQRGTDHVVWRSKYPVHTPSGLVYIAWQFGHDEYCDNHYAGEEVTQGQLIGYTGGRAGGVDHYYADHLHFSGVIGQSYNYVGDHLYELFYVNDTSIEVTGGYPWQTWTSPTGQYTVTLNISPEGSGYTTGQGQYNYGETATLTAYANEGYRFVRWSDGYNVYLRYWTITENLTLTAYFEAIPEERGVPLFNYDGTDIQIR